MVLTPSAMVEIGTPAPDFALPDTVEERTVSRSDFTGRPLLVAFLCNHCPYVRHIADRLAEVAREAQERGVAVVGISSNDTVSHPEDGPEKMKEEAGQRGYTFPYLFDGTQEVARTFQARCTPDLFLYDADHRLFYRGQFDAARPGNEEPVTGSTLRAAIDAVLEGTDPPAQVPSMGCNIKWKS